METDFSDRSSRAARHGKFFEETVLTLLPEAEPSPDGETDFCFLGAPLEAKSCQIIVVDNTKKGPNTKSGRIYLRDYQHEYLVKNRGRYVIGVMDGESVIKTRMILACRLSPNFDGCKTLTWRTLFKAIGACC